jgi:hypothetical protein
MKIFHWAPQAVPGVKWRTKRRERETEGQSRDFKTIAIKKRKNLTWKQDGVENATTTQGIMILLIRLINTSGATPLIESCSSVSSNLGNKAEFQTTFNAANVNLIAREVLPDRLRRVVQMYTPLTVDTTTKLKAIIAICPQSEYFIEAREIMPVGLWRGVPTAEKRIGGEEKREIEQQKYMAAMAAQAQSSRPPAWGPETYATDRNHLYRWVWVVYTSACRLLSI